MLEGCAEVASSWYLLGSSSAPIGAFEPKTVVARLLPGQGENAGLLIWTEQRIRRLPRHPPRPKQEGQAEIVAIEDAEEGEDLDEAQVEEDGAGEGFDAEAEMEALLEEAIDLVEDGFEVPADDPADSGAVEPHADAGAVGSGGAEPQGPLVEQPAAPELPPHPDRGARKGAEVTFHLIGGSISDYSSKSAFEAVCDHKGHGRCVLTRTSRARGVTPAGFPRGGRPVGFLAAWLSHSGECESKADHWRPDRLKGSHELRLSLRNQIAQTPAGRVLLSCERPLIEGEGPEPPSLDGLV